MLATTTHRPLRLAVALSYIFALGADSQLTYKSPRDHAVQPHAGCHTAVAGEECHDKLLWAMQSGILKYPDWFAPLTNSSSLEAFQRHLHGLPRFSGVCPQPCEERALEAVALVPARARQPPSVSCHAPVEGDACHRRVVWAMESGVVKYPDRFAPLTSSSRFEDFQRLLHGMPRFSDVCPEPCAPPAVGAGVPARLPDGCRTAVEGDACYRKVVWAMEAGLAKYPGWFAPLTSSSSFEDFQRHLHGIARFSDACPEPCAARAAESPLPAQARVDGGTPGGGTWIVEGYNQTAGNCECGNIIQAYATGYETPLLCAAACSAVPACMSIGVHEDTIWPGHCDLFDAPCDDSATCATPVHEQAISLNFNKELTASPTPAPTPPPDACEITNGTGPSASYPCTCGLDVCGTSEICSNETCSPPTYLHVDWPCSYPSIGDPNFILTGTSADGAPIYVNFHGSYIYYDVSCDGVVREAGEGVPNVTATPAPTLPPGVPCPCNQKCAGFPYVDTDGDGCLSPPECEYIETFRDRFHELDLDGDGCVTIDECIESPLGEWLPMFPIQGPNHCDFGSYFTPGTSSCVSCTNGETRRRRSEACTKCPAGKDDFGDFDVCIGGAYLKEPLYPGNCSACLNTGTDESGLTWTRGDRVVISTRNPDPGHYQVVTIEGVNTVGNLTCFEFSPCVTDPYDPYDPVTTDCTEQDGHATSIAYPCGCGIEECADGEVCDIDGNAGQGICFTPSGNLPTPAPTVSARGDPHLVNLHGEHFDVNHGGEFTLLRIPQATSEPPMLELKASIRPEHGKPCTTYITEVEVSGSLFGSKVVQVRSYLRSHVENETDKFLGLRVLERTPGAVTEAPWKSIAQETDNTFFVADPQTENDFRVTMSTAKWYSNKDAGEKVPSVAGQVEIRLGDPKDLGLEPARVLVRQDLPRQEHLNVAVRRLSSLGREDVGGLLGFDPHPESLEDVTPECQRHRDGLDSARGPRSQRGWKARWEKIKARRSEAFAPGGAAGDGDATAQLVSNGREAMCVCPGEEPHEAEEEERGGVRPEPRRRQGHGGRRRGAPDGEARRGDVGLSRGAERRCLFR
ncbi:unnamed protein product [Prorocentrum cordatum]|uniref:EF-hand domain-containing protein n=1 Tax=Prorocentrum cordatum TaxID=2364126 RepID=A0ABN9T6I2_9DINO|nr:unnamed protein product [Polarella glacialis]